jgi:hypothetical protein
LDCWWLTVVLSNKFFILIVKSITFTGFLS